MKYAFPKSKKVKIRPLRHRYWNREEHELFVNAIESGISIWSHTEISRYMNHIKTPDQIQNHIRQWQLKGYPAEWSAPWKSRITLDPSKFEFSVFLRTDEELDPLPVPDPEDALLIFPELYDHYYVAL